MLSRFVAEVTAIRAQLGLQELHLVGHSWGAAIALEYLLTGDGKGVRSVTFVGPLLSTPRWIEDANSLVAMLPKDTQDAIAAARMTGSFDPPEFQAANDVFESQFLVRTPRSQRRLPSCESTPVRFNAGLYEHMWGSSEFVATGTLRDYDRIDRLAEIRIPTLFLVGEHDEARPETMLEFQALVPGSVVKVIPGAAHAVNVDHRRPSMRRSLSFFPPSRPGKSRRQMTLGLAHGALPFTPVEAASLIDVIPVPDVLFQCDELLLRVDSCYRESPFKISKPGHWQS